MNDAKFTTNVIIKSIQVILEEKEKNKQRKELGKDGEKGGREEGKKREREEEEGMETGRGVGLLKGHVLLSVTPETTLTIVLLMWIL